jgi:hypothetical protein
MTKPIVRIYQDGGEFIDREMNDDEFAQYKIDKENYKKEKTAAEAKEAQRQALLDRLGITSKEAKILLGA